MKFKSLAPLMATLIAAVALPGCVVDGIASVTIPSRSHASDTVIIDDGYSDVSYSDSYGSDDVIIVDDGYDSGWRGRGRTTTTTVITQPAPVVVAMPQVPVQQAPALDPIIQSFTANPSNVVPQGQPITFTVVANDPGKQSLQFNWASTGGILSTNTGRVVTWSPPEKPGIYTVSTIITNSRGGAVTGTQNLTVLADGSIKTTTTTTTAVATTTTAATTATTTTAATATAMKTASR
ncbi:MAG: hypothetical protein JWM80_6682 [Cyanobacteria bacterium RYN_339]|nr:hypothetical protein [Cyanobacteria bacterium RYN_339]